MTQTLLFHVLGFTIGWIIGWIIGYLLCRKRRITHENHNGPTKRPRGHKMRRGSNPPPPTTGNKPRPPASPPKPQPTGGRQIGPWF